MVQQHAIFIPRNDNPSESPCLYESEPLLNHYKVNLKLMQSTYGEQ